MVMSKLTKICIASVLWIITVALVINISYRLGQLRACENSLRLNLLAHDLQLYCDMEFDDVYLKSMKDMNARVSMTTGKLEVAD